MEDPVGGISFSRGGVTAARCQDEGGREILVEASGFGAGGCRTAGLPVRRHPLVQRGAQFFRVVSLR